MEDQENEDNFEYVLNLEKLETGNDDRLIIAGMCSSGDIDHAQSPQCTARGTT